MVNNNRQRVIAIRVITLIYVFMGIISLAVALRVTFWALETNHVLEVKNAPIPARPPEVKAEDKVYIDIDFCKNTGDTGNIEVNLIGDSGSKIPINWPEDQSRAGCGFYTDIPVPIPANTPTDNYYVEFNSCYTVNPIKKNKCTHFISQKFKVINESIKQTSLRIE